jgi:hypothetical protein
MKRATFALALMTASGLAWAGGGKIAWTEPKNAKDFDRIQAESNFAGKAMIVYFSGEN